MMFGFFRRLRAERRGTMTIETAIVAPVLIILTLGIFEVGKIVARQHELQTTANEAAMIVLTANQGPTVELTKIKEIVRASVDLEADQISVTKEYRCALNAGRVKLKGSCPTSGNITEYILIEVTDKYVPTWTAFGIGKEINFSIDRTVQVTA